MIKRITTPVAFVLCLLALGAGPVAAQELGLEACGSLQNAYGPFDYRNVSIRREYLPRVEQHHFTMKVRTLQAGQSGSVLGDLDYTLRAFPNHPIALDALARYVLKGGTFPAEGIPTGECYFERAISFANDDPTVRVLYGNFLLKRGRKEDARAHFDEALRVAPESPDVNYNAGLFYLGLGDLEKAKQLAKVAYDGGYPLEGLRNKISVAEAKTTAR